MAKNGKAPQEIQEAGFEMGGTFYPWHVSDTGKDGLLIDRISGMSLDTFFEAVNDEHERQRTPILLGLMATSLRNAHPNWSVERILRVITDVHLGDVEYIGGDEEPEEEEASPPTDADEASTESSSTLKESPAEKSKKSSATPA